MTRGTVAVLLVAALMAAPASASSTPESCATLIPDPAPGYRGPLLHGFSCDYRPELPEVSWTVPAGVTEAEFHVYGGDHPSGRGGEVRAELTVAPGETLTLTLGHEGSASRVSRGPTPLLIAGGGDGKEPNFAEAGAREVISQAPGAPNHPYPGDGRIYGSWYEGWVELPDYRCTVPALAGLKPVEARRSLDEAGCATGAVSRPRARRARRNRVVGQSVKAGTRVPLDTAVSFTVGRR
jgi:hypothetical protein